MIILDNSNYTLRIVDDSHTLTATQQIVERENVRPHKLAELDEHGVVMLHEPSQCCHHDGEHN